MWVGGAWVGCISILSLMTELFDWARGSNINAIIKSCIIHFIIEYIHPFEDGNGRIGRLWHTGIGNIDILFVMLS